MHGIGKTEVLKAANHCLPIDTVLFLVFWSSDKAGAESEELRHYAFPGKLGVFHQFKFLHATFKTG